jgi:hypothetical protein
MIKIKTTEIDIDDLKDNHYNSLLGKPYNIKTNLIEKTNYYRYSGNLLYRDLYKYFIYRLKTILVGNPLELFEIIEEVSPLFFQIEENIRCANPISKIRTQKLKEFHDEIYEIFDYDKFSKRYGKYGAYELVQKLNVNVCPYCNRNYTNTVMFADGKSRARLDHWFSKSKYPFLSLSLFNLIPSCHICNSDMKGSADFIPKSHIHPYMEDFKNDLLFKSNFLKASYTAGDIDSINITLEPADGKLETDPLIIRSQNNCRDFGLVELYNWHRIEASKVIVKSKQLTKANIDFYLSKTWDDGTLVYKDRNDVLDSMFGIIFNSNKFDEYPLSKFKRDIAFEQKLIFQIE